MQFSFFYKNVFFPIIILLMNVHGVFSKNNLNENFNKKYHEAKQDFSKITTLIQWAQYKSSSDIDSALILAETALKMCEIYLKNEVEDTEVLARIEKNEAIILNILGAIYSNFGNNSGSVDSYLKSIELYKKLNLKEELAGAYINLGQQYQLQANSSSALKYLLKGLKIEEEIGNKKGIATSMNYLGMVYLSQEDTAKSLECNFKSLKLREELGDKGGIAQSLGAIGFIYKQKGVLAKALEFYDKSLKVTKDIGDDDGIATLLNNMGIIYLAQNNYSKALDLVDQSWNIYSRLHNKRGQANALSNIGRIYFKENDLKKSETSLLLSLKIAKEAGSPENIEYASSYLYELYSKRGDYKQALEMFKITSQMHDSISNQKTKQETLRKKLEYDYEKKLQNEKLKQAEENRIRDLELSRHRYMIWGLSILLILVLILAFYIIKHDNAVAAHRNLQLEQKLLRSQMNPHFIFNSLTAIESFIYKNDPKEAGKYLSGFAKLMRLILENSREEYILLSKEVHTLEHYLHLQKLRFEEKFDYKIDVEEGLDIDTIVIPPMLTQPFIENSIEHGIKNMHIKGQITIRFSRKHEHLIIEIKDNGIGIEKSMEVKKDNKLHQSLATIITKERLAMLNKRKSNKIKLIIHDLTDSHHHVLGTKVSFNIPYKQL